jgi:hypothetical protein
MKDMTRDTYDKATVSLDRVLKLKAIKEKLEREFPEFKYDKGQKKIADQIYGFLDSEITVRAKAFRFTLV